METAMISPTASTQAITANSLPGDQHGKHGKCGRQRDITEITPVDNAFLRVIDREMISQSVLPTHDASIFPAKSTHVVEMAARIEAGAFFSNR